MREINYIIGTPTSVIVNTEKFNELCKSGCRVFGTKYSCPPYSHAFRIEQWRPFHVVILWMHNIIEAKSEYTKVKAINSILKSKLNKLLHQYHNTHVLGSGSCRTCQKCAYPSPCKHPDKRIYSMEACGIDVEALCDNLGHKLQWYKKGQPYAYGTVVGLIKDSTENKLRAQIEDILEIRTKRFLITNVCEA